jgi:hypothetical protein
MRNWITFLMTLLVGSMSYVNANTGSQWDFEVGYRRDNLRWHVDIPESDPFFKTSARFKDLDIFQIGLHGRTNLGCNLYLRGSASWGWILDGDFQERVSVFASPIFSFDTLDSIEFTARDRNVIDDRYVFDIGAALGYPFYFCDCTLALSPVVGYAFDEQNIRVDGEHNITLTAVDGFLVPTSDGSGCCRHKSIFRWYGPFVGVDLTYHPYDACWGLYAEFEYHFGSFQLRRHDFSGFSGFGELRTTTHHADGFVFNVGADYVLCNEWAVGLNFKYQDWYARKRHHQHFSEFDEFGDSGNNRQKTHIDWYSYAINFTVGRDF